MNRIIICLLLLCCLPFSFTSLLANNKATALDEAIKIMRDVPSDLSNEERQEKSAELNKAWDIIEQAGPEGIARIKQELDYLKKNRLKDDYFRLSAAALLGKIGPQGEYVKFMVESLSEVEDINTNFQGLFYALHFLARTHRKKVLPALRFALKLKEDKQGAYIARHALPIDWSLALDFIYGIYGREAASDLVRVLKTSKNEDEQRGCIYVLGKFLDEAAKPLIREFAKKGTAVTQPGAIKALGYYGDPVDYDLFIGLLDSKNDQIIAATLFALWELADKRAAPKIIPFLSSSNKGIRNEAKSCLVERFPTPEGLKAVLEISLAEKDETKKTEPWIERLAEKSGVDKDDLIALKPDALEELSGWLNGINKDLYKLKETDKKLTKKQLYEAINDWIKRNRITGGEWEWVETRHILSVATPDDIDKLYELRASLYERLSDECLYEARTIDDIIHRLSRKKR